MLLCSTSWGIDVQVATQCRSSSAAAAAEAKRGPRASPFRSDFPAVGTAMTHRGDSSSNEAAMAPQLDVYIIMLASAIGNSRCQQSLGCG
jgi:hypothetical protein